MLRYALKRLLWLIPVLLGISVILFIVLQLTPGDAATLLLGQNPDQEVVAKLREIYGLNDPLHIQYLRLMRNLFTGQLQSIYYKSSVLDQISQRMPATIELGLFAMLIAAAVSLPIGIVAAVKKNTPLDYIGMMLALVGVSVPVFFTGVILMYLLSVYWNLLPSSGYGGRIWTASGLRHILLPGVALSTVLMASTSRLTRSSMLEVLQSDYVRTAKAKGLADRVVVLKHAFRNALFPVLTNLGNQLAEVLGGAVLTETVFSWPGVGRLAVDAVFHRDHPLVFGTVLFLSAIYVITNLIVDLLYVVVDPRVTYH